MEAVGPGGEKEAPALLALGPHEPAFFQIIHEIIDMRDGGKTDGAEPAETIVVLLFSHDHSLPKMVT
jgi:hypothetical protein